MKAMLVKNEKLVLSEVEKPVPKSEEILIEVRAIGINRADLLQRSGKYPSPKGWPEWPGLEVSGIVSDMGDDAKKNSGFAIGDKVCALLGGGGYAEFVCAPYGMVMPIPNGLSFEEAATLPEAYATSYVNLCWEGNLESGQTAFITAGASGLSSVAIPMAKAFGARVITTVSSEVKAKRIENLGADIIINLSENSVSEILKDEEAKGRPVNVAMDCLGGKMLGECLSYMADGGYWVLISTLAGVETEVMLRPVLTKSLHLVGSMLRKRSSEEKAKLLSELTEKVWPIIERGEIKPMIYKVLKMEEANDALDILVRGENIGKVVLVV